MCQNDKRLEECVTNYLVKLGVPVQIQNYSMMKMAIIMAIKDMGVVGSVTKLLYPDLAKKFGGTPSKAERALRCAVEASWKNGDQNLLETIFGYTQKHGKKRPTNSEYIAGVADQIRQHLDLSERIG